MEHFSIAGIIFFALMAIFVLWRKSKGERQISEDEIERKIDYLAYWVDWYRSLPKNKVTDELRRKYPLKYIEMRELQLKMQKHTVQRKDIDISENGKRVLEEYFPIAEEEIALVRSGKDPDEARRIAFNGTKYENFI